MSSRPYRQAPEGDMYDDQHYANDYHRRRSPDYDSYQSRKEALRENLRIAETTTQCILNTSTTETSAIGMIEDMSATMTDLVRGHRDENTEDVTPTVIVKATGHQIEDEVTAVAVRHIMAHRQIAP
ncbi:hypothetical protein CJF30_00004901 [Rutstroemia sp. NJR-2017a BBW]|nr:hypothetical protein CJF30_00004901 [Rutstroemia sp. NJR-2017a BBW]